MARLAVSLGLLALVWNLADGPAALQGIAAAEWSWFVLAVVVLNLQTVLSALRWQFTAGRLGMAFGTGFAVREYYLAQLVNQILPGGIVGDAGRAWRARAEAGFLAAGQAVLIERMAGQIALFATLGAGFVATLVVPGGLDWPRWLAIPVSGLLVAGALLPVVVSIVARGGGMTGRSARRALDLVRRALTGPGVAVRQISLSLATVACTLAAFACCARAVDVDLPFPVVVTLVPLILLSMLVPVSVSGWGLREGAAAALLPLAGVPAGDALACSVLFGFAALASACPGALFLKTAPPVAAAK